MRHSLTRLAFVMQLKTSYETEYHQRHQQLWGEMEQAIKAHGAHHYSIFLHPQTRQLFGYVEVESLARWQQLATTEICQRWWAFMAEIMEVNPDNSPHTIALNELFYLP